MVANKYAFLQITRRRFLNEWEAFKKVISRRNIRRRITIPLTLSNLKLLRRITRTENILDNQKEIAEMQNETQKEIAGIQSATSRQNTKDQVYAQNEMLAYQQKESTARVASIMENTNLSKQQQVSEIMRQMLTQAQTAGQYFTNDQIKEMTRKVS